MTTVTPNIRPTIENIISNGHGGILSADVCYNNEVIVKCSGDMTKLLDYSTVISLATDGGSPFLLGFELIKATRGITDVPPSVFTSLFVGTLEDMSQTGERYRHNYKVNTLCYYPTPINYSKPPVEEVEYSVEDYEKFDEDVEYAEPETVGDNHGPDFIIVAGNHFEYQRYDDGVNRVAREEGEHLINSDLTYLSEQCDDIVESLLTNAQVKSTGNVMCRPDIFFLGLGTINKNFSTSYVKVTDTDSQ